MWHNIKTHENDSYFYFEVVDQSENYGKLFDVRFDKFEKILLEV